MKTTKYGMEVINVAKSFVTPEDICYEVTTNKGNCIDELKCIYKGILDNCNSSKIQDEAYCAITVWVFNLLAQEKMGLDSTFWKTKMKTAGAKDMLNKAKANGIKVDKNPTPGSIFYRKPGIGSTASGHNGLVVWKDDKYFYTIEGNNTFNYNGKKYEGVWGWSYPLSVINGERDYQFMHTEAMYGNNYDVEIDFSNNNGLITLASKNSNEFDEGDINWVGIGFGAGVMGLSGFLLYDYLKK